MSHPPRRIRLARRAVAAGYGAAATLAKTLPEPFVRAVFKLAADVAWRRRGRGVVQLEANLRRVVPSISDDEMHALSRRALRSYARYWLEFFRLPVLGADRILGRMSVDGEERLRAALDSGRGAILALPHTGNWDHAGAWVALRGNPFTTVAERLKPESLFDRFVAVRERLGMEVLPLTSDASTFAVLLKRLRAGQLVCLVSERDLATSGVEVSFFGEPTTMPAGPASLAIATGAALLPTTLWFTDDSGPASRRGSGPGSGRRVGRGGGWGATIHPEIVPPAEGDRRAKVAAMTQQLADAFASGIAEHPHDWHMLQPLWIADRAAPRATSTGADAAIGEPVSP
ncbi:MAG: phosphatidylinositol mannoside acyltransferase [Acidothermaceae bacterium]